MTPISKFEILEKFSSAGFARKPVGLNLRVPGAVAVHVAAQLSSRPGWLQALALLRLREGGDGGRYCLGCEKGCAGLVWLVLPVGVGLAWGLPMGAARDEFLGAEVPNGEQSSSRCRG